MSASPSTAVPRIFYHPAFWCHSCDMSIGLPPSPTPDALLCPHCHRDSLEQMDMDMGMDMEDPIAPPLPAARDPLFFDHHSFTPADDNFLLTSPYLHRLIHHITTAAAASPQSEVDPKSAIEALQEVTVTPESDPTDLCPVCKEPFVVSSVVKVTPCKHSYHSDCIVPWLERNNSCPVCRCKLPAEDKKEIEQEGFLESMGLEELEEDGMDLYGTLRRIARGHQWSDDGYIASGSEGHLFSPTQIAEVERGSGVLERENSVETVSSLPRWQVEERGGGGGGNDDHDVSR